MNYALCAMAGLVLGLAACGGGESTPSAEPATSSSALGSATASGSQSLAAVCDVFSDGTWDTIREVIIGNLRNLDPEHYENLAGPLRDGIDGLERIAQRAGGDEQKDLQGLADRLDDLALAADYSSVIDYTDPFYVKYAPGCGLKLAQ